MKNDDDEKNGEIVRRCQGQADDDAVEDHTKFCPRHQSFSVSAEGKLTQDGDAQNLGGRTQSRIGSLVRKITIRGQQHALLR
jgi:hypothetical protein